MMSELQNHASEKWSVWQHLQVAAWYGLVTGLVSGAGVYYFQQWGWLNWNVAKWQVTRQIIWISPIFNLIFFCVVGLILAAVGRLLPRLEISKISVFTLTFLLCLNWLALTGRLRIRSVLILAIGMATVFVRWYLKRPTSVMKFWKMSVIGLAAATVILTLSLTGIRVLREWDAMRKLPAGKENAPNVLVIVVDTLRADHVSSYGYSRPTTPNLDEFAKTSVQFDEAIAASSWTLPSHASMLTGRYPHEHKAQNTALDNRYPTIAEVLLSKGYRTGAISANLNYFGRAQGFGRGFIHFEDYFRTLGDMAVRTIWGRYFDRYVREHLGFRDIPGRKGASDVSDSAIEWIDSDKDHPFFLFLNYFDVHHPYLPPEPYRSQFAQPGTKQEYVDEPVDDYSVNLSKEQVQGRFDAYDGAIRFVDENIGKLLRDLDERGLTKNTIVIITSDHGTLFGEHGLFLHRVALYRQLIRVPLWIRWPGQIPGGVHVATPISTASLPSTILSLLGDAKTAIFPLPSLAFLWSHPGPHLEWPDPISELARMPFPGAEETPAYHGAMKSVLNEQWHYIYNEKLGTELYNWRQDSEEKVNLADTIDGKMVVAELAEQLRRDLLH